MIKQDHENESLQKISARKNLNRISQITFHIETRRKTRYQYIFASNRLISIHRNNAHFSEKFAKSCVQKKIIASEKVYNRHVLEKKQFTNKTFIFIYYRLLSQKYEHDSIIS